MKALLGIGYNNHGFRDWDDVYTDALYEAENDLECHDQIIEWLENNLYNRYQINDEYEPIDVFQVKCYLILTIPNETDAVAFKLTWGQLEIF